jgi:hypothetical protein
MSSIPFPQPEGTATIVKKKRGRPKNTEAQAAINRERSGLDALAREKFIRDQRKAQREREQAAAPAGNRTAQIPHHLPPVVPRNLLPRPFSVFMFEDHPTEQQILTGRQVLENLFKGHTCGALCQRLKIKSVKRRTLNNVENLPGSKQRRQ